MPPPPKKDPDPLDKLIGGRVRDARTAAEMAQAELGRALEFPHPSSLYRYEAGLRGFTKRQLVLIADKLRVSIDWLLTGAVSAYGAPSKDAAVSAAAAAAESPPQSGILAPVPALGPKPLRQATPKLMRELFSQLGAKDDEDEQFLLEYLGKPGNQGKGILDAERALKSDRYARNGTPENFIALQEVNERQQKSAGVKRALPPDAIKKRRPANDGTLANRRPSRRKADRNR